MAFVAVGGSIGWVLRDRAARLSTVQRAEGHYDRGFKLRSEGRLAEAVTEYQEAIRLLENDAQSLHILARFHNELANVLGDQPDRLAEAFDAAHKGLEINKKLVAENPNSTAYLSSLAISYFNIGNGYWLDWGRDAEAIECWEKSHKLLSLLIDQHLSANSNANRYSFIRSCARSRLCTALVTWPNGIPIAPFNLRKTNIAEHQDR
jgi:tetratricopeptide (TPR) repeat protein